MAELVLREDRDGLATLALNRPEKLDSLDVGLFTELRGHIDQIANETDRIGLVVVAGRASVSPPETISPTLPPACARPSPTFSPRRSNGSQTFLSRHFRGSWTLLHGRARVGAGRRPDLRCRVRKVRRYSRTICVDSDLGDEPAAAQARRPGQAREMMLTFDLLGAEAAAMGLANFCVPDDSFDKELRGLTDTILANSWFSHRGNKRLLVETDGLPLAAGLAHEVYRPRGGPDARADRGLHQRIGASWLDSDGRAQRRRMPSLRSPARL